MTPQRREPPRPLQPSQAVFERGARILAWLLLAAVVFVTLGPVSDRPQFGHPDLERFAAYAATAVVFSFGYRRAWPALAIGLVGMAAGLEAAQWVVRNRDPHVSDLLFKCAGVLAGLAAARVTSRVLTAAPVRESL